MKNRLELSFILVVCFMIYSCAIPNFMPRPQGNPGNPLKRIAILPLQNDTTDVEAPEFVRRELAKAFKEHLYNVMPIAETNKLLRDKMGITLGGQLKSVKPKTLRKILNVEGVVFGTLMDFGEITTGVYNQRKVRARIKLMNAIDNKVFWQNGIGVKSHDQTGDLAGSATSFAAGLKDKSDKDVPWVTLESENSKFGAMGNLAAGLGKKLFSKATHSHLKRETEEMVRRITSNLPSGPGTSMAFTPISNVAMPEIKMPAFPSFGYLDYGKRDFSAIMHSTTINKKNKERFFSKIPLAKSGKKFRFDMDFKQMYKGKGHMPDAFSRIVMIYRGDKKLTYSLYPNKSIYMIYHEGEENYYEKPKIEKSKKGRETIDGHPCDKFKVKIIYKDGMIQRGYIWNARDLHGMTIKSELEDKDFRFTSILKKVVLKTPSSKLFIVPNGYKKTKGFMEMMMNQ